MRVKFYIYNGLAGDDHELLIGIDESGRKYSQLFNRSSYFKLFRLRRAKNKILNEIELLTGKKVIELI